MKEIQAKACKLSKMLQQKKKPEEDICVDLVGYNDTKASQRWSAEPLSLG